MEIRRGQKKRRYVTPSQMSTNPSHIVREQDRLLRKVDMRSEGGLTEILCTFRFFCCCVFRVCLACRCARHICTFSRMLTRAPPPRKAKCYPIQTRLLSYAYKRPSPTTNGMNMSWRASASSNKGLIDQLKGYNIVKSPEVEEAMRATDRGLYSKDPHSAYIDRPHPIGFGATISGM